MSLIHKTGRGRIPLHRSVRYVRFSPWRAAGWVIAAALATGGQLYFNRLLTRGFGLILEGLLHVAQVPFEPGAGDRLAFINIPSWSVTTFNPAALLPTALLYAGAGVFLSLAIWWIPKVPFPMKAWVSLLGMLLLIITAVLGIQPVPRFTPEIFSGLWMKITVATSLLFPWVWATVVGILPLPVFRVGLWGLVAWVLFVAWNVTRLAVFLALARAAGVLWLPIAFIFGSTLMDCFVFIIAFSRVLEPAGREWQEPV